MHETVLCWQSSKRLFIHSAKKKPLPLTLVQLINLFVFSTFTLTLVH